jgi:hypothetical protein
MANEPAERPGSLLQSVARMVETAVNDGTGYDALIPILSLLCLVSILGHGQPTRAVQAAPATGTSPLQKLLGDLSKGDGGSVGPETLVSLLPLLNNPQIKSKLNPATLGAIMGLLGNIGDKGEKGEPAKQEKAAEKAEKGEEKREERRVAPPPTAATATTLDPLAERQDSPDQPEADKKGLGKYLNWKSNF